MRNVFCARAGPPQKEFGKFLVGGLRAGFPFRNKKLSSFVVLLQPSCVGDVMMLLVFLKTAF